jgi:hypothetical protein
MKSMRACSRPAVLILALFSGFALTLTFSGCVEENPPSLPPVDHIVISPSPLLLCVNGSGTPPSSIVTATLLTKNNVALPPTAVNWTSSDNTTISVTPNASNPDVVTLQALKAGTATVTVTEPKTAKTASVNVSSVANGISELLSGATSSGGVVGTLVNAPIPSGPDAAPVLGSSTLQGALGATVSTTVSAAIPITDILLGIPGQSGYLDLAVASAAATRQVPPILGGFPINMTIVPSTCQEQFTVAVVTKDAAGQFSTSSLLKLTVAGQD